MAHGSGSAEVLRSRLVPFDSPNSKWPMQMVITTWRNTGHGPIRDVEARFKFRDRNKQILAIRDYTLYAAYDDEPGIQPGKSYTTPKGEGYIFFDPLEKPHSVDVEILSVSEHSGL